MELGFGARRQSVVKARERGLGFGVSLALGWEAWLGQGRYLDRFESHRAASASGDVIGVKGI